jgi:TetR/AcrR family transcriptional repressor of nem operon
MSITAPTQPRGRPREFDEQAALDALTGLFWQKGYEATSIADIVRVSGVNKSSLYNAYGSKQDLFRFVLSRYVERRMAALADLADNSTGAATAPLHSFLDAIREFGRAGCLAVNTSTELGTSDPAVVTLAQDYRDRTRASVRQIVAVVSDKSGLAPDLIESRTDMLLAFLLGFSVAVRGGAKDDEVERFIQAAHDTVDSWQI